MIKINLLFEQLSHISTPNLLYIYQSVSPLACFNALHSVGSRYGNLSLSTMHQTCPVTQHQLALCSSLLPSLLPSFLTSTFPSSLLRFLPLFFLLSSIIPSFVCPLFPFPVHPFIPSFSPFFCFFHPSLPLFLACFCPPFLHLPSYLPLFPLS